MTAWWFQEGSDEVLARWLNSGKAKEEDRKLVKEVLRTLEEGTWYKRWKYTKELIDDPSLCPPISIRPRKKLVVLVRFWPAEDRPEVQLISIFEDEGPDDFGLPED